ncbi:MAG: Eco57I restriction-modification methylase domain-containing protein [Bacillota bacterium]
MLLEKINKTTIEYIKNSKKKDRKKIGQFFTPDSVAKYMSSLSNIDNREVKILDPGTGSGILTAALCEKIVSESTISKIQIDFYENDKRIIPLLEKNILIIKKYLQNNDIQVNINLFKENFILFNKDLWHKPDKSNIYDIVIANPPYKKIKKSSPESQAMLSIVYGQPNIYFLFMAMAAHLLKDNGEMIFIIPRSFSSGAYFKKFREWFFNKIDITNLHLFISRSNVFKNETVLQETIILKGVNRKEFCDEILITESKDLSNLDKIEKYKVSKELMIERNTDNYFMKIPTDEEDISLLKFINEWSSTLTNLGFKLKTGPVVKFRNKKFIKNKPAKNTVPLIWANHFKENKIEFPNKNMKKPQYIINNQETKKMLLKNKDYLLLKRFTSKEEKKRIQPALYLSNQFDFSQISLENHLNYLATTKEDEEITKIELYGIYTILNSSFVDKYYRILNGNTQVNASELNSMPFPNKNKIKEIGKLAMDNKNLNTYQSNEIIKYVFELDSIKFAI